MVKDFIEHASCQNRKWMKTGKSYKNSFIRSWSIKIKEREIDVGSENEDLLDNSRIYKSEMFGRINLVQVGTEFYSASAWKLVSLGVDPSKSKKEKLMLEARMRIYWTTLESISTKCLVE